VIQETAYPALTDLTPDVDREESGHHPEHSSLGFTSIVANSISRRRRFASTTSFITSIPIVTIWQTAIHQVMLSTRELAAELPAQAQTWVNENLQFTHGYGLVMNSVSKTIGGGFPQYLIKDIPPVSQYGGLNTTQPAIYYGEVSPGYKIVSTGIKEFDYPKGNENVYTSYQGSGGIPLDGIWKRLLFAWTQKDVNILFTSYLTPQSKIQIWRSVQERVSQIAPFLLLTRTRML